MTNYLLVAMAIFALAGCKGKGNAKPDPAPATNTKVAPPSIDAAPAMDAAPKTAPRAFFTTLKAGRGLAKKKDYEGALVEFQRALELWPNDPVALSEISWAAFLLGDYDRAIDAGAKSVQHAKRPSIRAASLYNLGRALEAKGSKQAAIVAYQTSLLLRPNQTVRERAATLLGKPKAGGSYEPQPLLGPMALPDVCKHVKLEACKNVKVAVNLARVEAPYQQVAVLQLDQEIPCLLAIHLEAGWFIGPSYLDCSDGTFPQTIQAVQLVQQDAGAPWVRFDYQIKTPELASSRLHARAEYSVICAVGTKGVPACTPAISRYSWEWEKHDVTDDDGEIIDEKIEETEAKHEISISSKGVLTIESADSEKPGKAYPLVFP